MTQATFRSTYFALLESYAPQLLAGPEAARNSTPRAQPFRGGAVHIFGVLGQGDWFADTDYSAIRAQVKQALSDPSVKTVDLLIDSPGGSVIGLPETADTIFQANRTKPVRAFVTGIAASAAYWLASQASTISLTPSGEVGSVGVLDLHVNVSKALDSAGIEITPIVSDPKKTERAPFTALSDDAKAYAQQGVDAWYQDFLNAIRRGRGARAHAGSTFGGGRMLRAPDALCAGMVDFVSGGAF